MWDNEEKKTGIGRNGKGMDRGRRIGKGKKGIGTMGRSYGGGMGYSEGERSVSKDGQAVNRDWGRRGRMAKEQQEGKKEDWVRVSKVRKRHI